MGLNIVMYVEIAPHCLYYPVRTTTIPNWATTIPNRKRFAITPLVHEKHK